MKLMWTVCLIAMSSSATREQFRFAVTSLKGYRIFYTKIKNSSQPAYSSSAHFPTETVEEKKRICAAIIGNPYFPVDDHYGNMLNLHDEDVRQELKRDHPDFFESHYGVQIFANSSSAEPINPYRLRNVTAIQESYQELVFSCLSRNRGPVMLLGVTQYFVTAAYDVNEVTLVDGAGAAEKIMGRFVFAYSGILHLSLVALAEEVATRPAGATDQHLHLRVLAENAFWSRHYAQNFSRDRPDAICKLARTQKIRLCTAILNSDGYREEFTTLPEFDIVPRSHRQECVRRKLYFKYISLQSVSENSNSSRENDTTARRHEVDDNSKDEWMIPCNAVRVKNREPVTRFVLRSSRVEPNKYYVGVETDVNKTYIDSYCFNVGVRLSH